METIEASKNLVKLENKEIVTAIYGDVLIMRPPGSMQSTMRRKANRTK